jgi:dihydroxyacetone kinase-like predicted kinase
MPDPRLAPDTPPEVQDAALADVLEGAVRAGEESVKRSPELLEVLREAGVVDAGGYAVTVLFAGVVAALRGDAEPPPLEHHAPARVSHPEHESSTYQYCTNFAVTGEGLEANRFVAPLEELGDSVLVVGDAATLKVHVHTDEPERAMAVFAGHGEVSRLDVADMREQMVERAERLAPNGGGAPARCAVLAVASGAGMRVLFEGFGAHVVDGGATMNPSTYELLAGLHGVDAEEIVVLPNSANVILAAEQAAALSEKQVRVVGSTSPQAGLAAVVALNPDRSADENAAALEDALAHVRTGAVAPAARDDTRSRFVAGDAVGFVGDEVIAWGDPADALRAVMAALGEGDAELLTCLAGEGAPLGLEGVQALVPDGVELEWRLGGQQGYWWLLAAE